MDGTISQAKPVNYKRWARRWFTGPHEDQAKLRDQYRNDFKRYRAAFFGHENFTHFQETGIEYFIRLERKLLEQVRLQPYRRKGQELLQSFQAASCCPTYPLNTNVVFVAMDFEGAMHHKGIDECGIAEVDVDAILSESSGASIQASNFGLKACRDRRFVFGQSIKTHLDLLPRTIKEHFEDLRVRLGWRQVVLVGHGISNELLALRDLEIALEDLSIQGVVDTSDVAKEVLGCRGGLSKLLTMLDIPHREHSLHCAGNDAHYTLQVLLALVEAKSGHCCVRLSKLARQPASSPQAGSGEEATSLDWDKHLDGDIGAGLFA